MINKRIYLTLLTLSLISYTGIAQNPQLVESINEISLRIGDILLQEEKVLNDAGTISVARFRTDTTPQLLSNAQAVLKNILPIRNNDELREIIMQFMCKDSVFLRNNYYLCG